MYRPRHRAPRSSRHAVIAVTAAALLTLIVGTAAAAMAGGEHPDHKTALCHRTASDSNPYVYLEVDDNALPAHLNDLPGHPPKLWLFAGTWRGVDHAAGDPKRDYLATSEADCADTVTTPPTTEPPVTDPPTTAPPTTEPPTTTPPTHDVRCVGNALVTKDVDAHGNITTTTENGADECLPDKPHVPGTPTHPDAPDAPVPPSVPVIEEGM